MVEAETVTTCPAVQAPGPALQGAGPEVRATGPAVQGAGPEVQATDGTTGEKKRKFKADEATGEKRKKKRRSDNVVPTSDDLEASLDSALQAAAEDTTFEELLYQAMEFDGLTPEQIADVADKAMALNVVKTDSLSPEEQGQTSKLVKDLETYVAGGAATSQGNIAQKFNRWISKDAKKHQEFKSKSKDDKEAFRLGT